MTVCVSVKEGGEISANRSFVGNLETGYTENHSRCPSLALASCLHYFRTHDLALRIFTLLPSSAISICSTLLDLFPSQSKILLKLPLLTAA